MKNHEDVRIKAEEEGTSDKSNLSSSKLHFYFLHLVICASKLSTKTTPPLQYTHQQSWHGGPGPAQMHVFLLLDKLSTAFEHPGRAGAGTQWAVHLAGRDAAPEVHCEYAQGSDTVHSQHATGHHQPHITLEHTYLSPVIVMVKPSYSFP